MNIQEQIANILRKTADEKAKRDEEITEERHLTDLLQLAQKRNDEYKSELDQWQEVGAEIAVRGIPLDLMPRLKALLAKGKAELKEVGE